MAYCALRRGWYCHICYYPVGRFCNCDCEGCDGPPEQRERNTEGGTRKRGEDSKPPQDQSVLINDQVREYQQVQATEDTTPTTQIHKEDTTESRKTTKEEAARYFHVDMYKNGKEAGLTLETTPGGVYIRDITGDSATSNWNARCARTFPDDHLQQGDRIVEINKTQNHNKFEMIIERDERIFMIIRRITKTEQEHKRDDAHVSTPLPAA